MFNILVVDDSDVDRLLMEGLLKQFSGFETIAAENGTQALQKLEEWSIDLILTDLQMPKMDGLELVQAVRTKGLQIPVVLTTGAGSEDIAAAALRAGAAGYIPKTKLNQLLVSTVREVLEIFRGEQNYSRLLECSKVSRFEFDLGNDPTLIPLVVDFCDQMLRTMAPLDQIDCLRIAIAVDQAIRNAMYRGNLEIDRDYKVPTSNQLDVGKLPLALKEKMESEPYRSRTVNVVVEIKPSGFAILIGDQGPGFDTSQVGEWQDQSSRGINLIKAFMDKVRFNKRGNEVQLSFRFDRNRVKRPPQQRRSAAVLAGRLICQSTGAVHEVDEKKYVVGRRAACHLRLQGDSIAPLHCMLVNEGDFLMLLNLSPEHETLVNGKPGNGKRLKTGDTISIGKHRFTFETDNGSKA
jgi:CheY-like chemotaxis protein